jgi:hypothetical protein
MRTRHAALIIPLLLGACAAPGAPIPVKGDAQVLAGRWSGIYSSNETGRSGSIMFTLVAGSDTASGDVLMIPNWPGPYYISQYVPPDETVSSPEPLRIQLVRVFGHQVAGQLAPYTDPDCECEVTTIFSGRLEGNSLLGVFHTYHPDGRTRTGEWRVERQAGDAPARE